VDELLDRASAAMDVEARRKLLQQIAAAMKTDVPVIPLYRQTDLYALAKDLEFQPRVDRRIRGREMRWR
jgi:ABC-type transport system substrate-binding protein